jgi:hypothetical protein
MDNIKIDLKGTGSKGIYWIHLAQVDKVLNLRDPQNARSPTTVPTELPRLLSSSTTGIYGKIILKCVLEK